MAPRALRGARDAPIERTRAGVVWPPMVAIVLSAVVTCVAALAIGQAALRVCGFQRWSWLAPPVGFSIAMVVAIPALHLPGRATTTAVLLALLVVVSLVVVLRDPAMRPPLGGLLAPLPVALLTLVPYAAAGQAGILGVGFDNDMANHLIWAEGYRVAPVNPLAPLSDYYPLGPHAFVATLAQGLGLDVVSVFAGLTAAAAVMLAWTVLGLLRGRVGWLGRMAAATVVGMPFLVAGYYGQGSFKELLQAMFVVAVVVALVDVPQRPGLLRWVPLALIAGGTISVYSVLGLPWIVGIAGAALAIWALRRVALTSPRAVVAEMLAGLGPAVVALAVLVLAMATQISRVQAFIAFSSSDTGTPIRADDLGNLVGRLPLWEAFGVWDNPDYRLPALDSVASGMWTAFVLALVVVGVGWCVSRGDWVVVAGGLVAFAIWVVSDRTQSPYVAAKALMLLSPLLLVLAVRPLVERDGGRPRWWYRVAPLLALVLVFKVVESSWQALRYARVGPTAHREELRSLLPLLDGKPTLFLGNDDFILSELPGAPVDAPVIGFPRVLFKEPKGWVYGQAIDIDSVHADVINVRDWIITTRDSAGSAMPPQLELVKQTRDYALWRRTGIVRERAVLAEGDAGGAILDCKTASGRKIVRDGGVALIRPPSTGVAVAPFALGTSIGVDLPLTPGTYDLAMPYVSPQPIELQVVGHLETTMPASLDRPGPRWPIGRVTIRAGENRLVRIGMYAHKTRFTPAATAAQPTSIVATPVGGMRTVAIRRACGKLVDWYQPAHHG
jgi:hypothetical protein